MLGVKGCMKGGMDGKEGGVKEKGGVDGVGVGVVGTDGSVSGVGGRTGVGVGTCGAVFNAWRKAMETVPPTFTTIALVSPRLLGEEGSVRDVVLFKGMSLTEAEVMEVTVRSWTAVLLEVTV